MTEPTAFPWKPDPEFWSANRAEHVIIGGYELVAFDLPSTLPGVPHIIGWELFTGPDLHKLVDKGDAPTFEAAKAAAEAAYLAREANRSTRH
jgi:hypothetical protein